jgi:CBS domain-containing protein
MAIGEICSRQVIFIRKSESVRQAAQLMREYHVGALVVAEESGEKLVPVGILTDRDIAVGIVAKGLDAEALSVGEVMTPEPLAVRESAGVSETIELMRTRGVRRLPVVDANGGLVGVVTADDFIDLLAEELNALARMISREQRREIDTRKV